MAQVKAKARNGMVLPPNAYCLPVARVQRTQTARARRHSGVAAAQKYRQPIRAMARALLLTRSGGKALGSG